MDECNHENIIIDLDTTNKRYICMLCNKGVSNGVLQKAYYIKGTRNNLPVYEIYYKNIRSASKFGEYIKYEHV